MDHRPPYQSPFTPRINRTGRFTHRDSGRPPIGSRSWHGPPRRPFYRSPRRLGDHIHSQAPSRPGGWQSRQFQPHRQHRWYPPGDENDSSDFQSNLEPMFSSLRVNDQWRGMYPPQQKKIPQIISPNARDQSFTEIMNGAFDLEKSPLSLGKKLANNPTLRTKDWVFQHPFDVSNNSDPEDLPSPTPVRSGKRVASSLLGPTVKQTKSARASFERVDHSPPVSAVESRNPFPTETRNNDVTVGFTVSSGDVSPQPTELSHLMQMIQRNTEQSKELAGLVLKYLRKTRGSWNDDLPGTGHLEQVCAESLAHKQQSYSGPQIATLAGGGDSPDPPRDHRNPFRGHMIDRVDFNMGTTADESSEPLSGSESESGTTKAASVFTDPQVLSSDTSWSKNSPSLERQAPTYDDFSTRLFDDTASSSTSTSSCGVTIKTCRPGNPKPTGVTASGRHAGSVKPFSDDLHSSRSSTSISKGKACMSPNHISSSWDRRIRSPFAPSPEPVEWKTITQLSNQEKLSPSNNGPEDKGSGSDSVGNRGRVNNPVSDKTNQVGVEQSGSSPISLCGAAHRDTPLLYPGSVADSRASSPGVETTSPSCRCGAQGEKMDTE